MKKNMVYFVLYIVLLSELLVVITERDDLQEAENQIRDKMIVTIANIYKKPVFISIPEQFSEYDVKSKDSKKIIITPVGLYSEQEKKNVKLHIDLAKGSPIPPNWPDGGLTNSSDNKDYSISLKNGNAIFDANLRKPAKYKFNVYCELDRVLPSYLPERLLVILKDEIGNTNLHQISSRKEFEINAKLLGGLKHKEIKYSF